MVLSISVCQYIATISGSVVPLAVQKWNILQFSWKMNNVLPGMISRKEACRIFLYGFFCFSCGGGGRE